MGNLEELKLSAAKDSMGDAAAAMLSELASNTGRLETEIIAIKVSNRKWILKNSSVNICYRRSVKISHSFPRACSAFYTCIFIGFTRELATS